MVQYVSAEEAVSMINSGNRIFSHGSACTPNLLIDELAKQSHRLKQVEFVSITQQGNVEVAKPHHLALELFEVVVALQAHALVKQQLGVAVHIQWQLKLR